MIVKQATDFVVQLLTVSVVFIQKLSIAFPTFFLHVYEQYLTNIACDVCSLGYTIPTGSTD